jgi:hypothetical protein
MGNSSCSVDNRLGSDDFEIFANAPRSEVMECVVRSSNLDPDVPQVDQILLDVERQEIVDSQLSPATVILHIYDVNALLTSANNVLSFSIGGAFHTGLEAFGSEWSYGCGGVSCEPPRTADHIYRCSMILGQTTLIQWVTELHNMCQIWIGSDYDMLSGHNCNGFVAELCRRLDIGPIPHWVDRFSRIAHQGRKGSASIFRAANDVKDLLMKNPHDKITEQLKAQIIENADQVLKLPQSQIVVHGQKVAMEDEIKRSQQEGNNAPYIDKTAEKSEQKSHKPVFVRDTQTRVDNHATNNTPQAQAREITMSERELAPELPRDPASRAISENLCAFPCGAHVEYYSTSQRCWIPAKVLAFDPSTCLYDLTCKQQVPALKIRSAMSGEIEGVRPAAARGVASADTGCGTPGFQDTGIWFPPGCSVEYESTTAESWIPAVILAYHADSGLYDLDCKSQVPE